MEFLGIEIDTNAMELRISDDRLQEIICDLQLWKYRVSCNKRELLSIIGKLMFVSRVVRAGRTFVRRMIDMSKCVKHLHHKITLDNSMKADIQWWIEYLPTWNGVSVMYDTIWSSNINLHLWSDASDVGIGGYFDGRWLAAPLTDHIKRQTIAWRELYALVVALSTWSQHIQHKRILFYIDNAAIVHIINNGCSKNKDLMTLVRSLFFYSCRKFI